MPTRIPTEELLDDLQKIAAEHGEPLTASTYREYGSYSCGTIRNRLGSWTQGLIEAGVETNSIPTGELLDDLQKIAAEHGEPLTERTYQEHGSYSRSTIHRRLGSWTQGLTEAGVETHSINPIDILTDIRESVEDGRIGVTEYRSVGSFSHSALRSHFERWWRAAVIAGVRPATRRPLTPEQFDQLYHHVVDLQPVDALPPLLFMFTGMSAPVACKLSSEWVQEKRSKNILRVPAKATTDSPWIVRLPDTWVNPYTGDRHRTTLPAVMDWVCDQYGEMPYSTEEVLNSKCLRVAENAAINSREQVSRYIGHSDQDLPLVRPTDLNYTHGCNLVRQGIDATTIERQLGVVGYRETFNVDDMMLWVYVHEGYEHPAFEPPPVVLDPASGEPRYS